MKEIYKEQIWNQVLKSTEKNHFDSYDIVNFLKNSHEQIFKEKTEKIVNVDGEIHDDINQ